MIITCTKEELADMITHCVYNSKDMYNCDHCAIHERCKGAYADSLTKMIHISDPEANMEESE